MIGKIDFNNWKEEGKPENKVSGSYYDTILGNLEDLSKGDNSKLENPFKHKRLSRERHKVKTYEEPINPFQTYREEEKKVVESSDLSNEEYKEKALDIANKLFGDGVVQISDLKEEEGESEDLATLEIEDSIVLDVEVDETIKEIKKDFVQTVADIILDTVESGELSKDFEQLHENNIKEDFIKEIESIPNDSRFEHTSEVLLEFLKHKPKITANQLDRFNAIYNKLRPYNKLRHRIDDNIKINKYLKAIKIDLSMSG